ncbi:MAG TPA: hypothetical protein VFZ53_16145, partial [Polyangiaceae bacterium]
MSHELLERSMQAYRDEHPGAALDANAIRRRVLLRAGTRRRRRLVLLRLGLPLAATFFVSVALAASQFPFPRFDEVRRWLGGEAPQATAGGPVSGRPPNRARAPVLPPPQVSTP